MKSLSKKQIGEKEKLASDLADARTALETAISEYNAKLEDLKGPVEVALGKLNDVVREANEWTSAILSDMESYYDERSEKWQEGDAGSNYSSWKDEYSGELEEADITFPDALEMPDDPNDSTISDMPDSPDA